MYFTIVKKWFSKNYWVFFYPIFVFFFFKMQLEKSEIKRYRTFAFGTVTHVSKIYRKYSKKRYHYVFFYKKEEYHGSTNGNFSDNIRVGNRYTVEFSSKDPSKNKMLFDNPYFEKKDSILITN